MTSGDASIILTLGTRNAKKGREMLQLLAPPWECDPVLSRLVGRTLDQVDLPVPEVVEDAPDFTGNADKKAREVALALRCWTLADDSGLAVDALDGRPGVHSARYAGLPTNDAANNAKLLEELADVEDARRTAAFHCHLSLADPTGTIRLRSQGICRGLILRQNRGEGGFGYDPLFYIREYHRSFGELSPLVKAQLSHRARAFTKLKYDLRSLMIQEQLDSLT